MVADFKNLFFQFRGPHSSGSADFREKQLEDNATKALVFVLEHSDRELVLGPFLRAVLRLDHSPRLNQVEFALQRTDIGRPSVRRRVGVALAPRKGLADVPGGHRGQGRPDAWIWSDGEFSLFIETKVSGQVSRQQMDGHARHLVGWAGRARTYTTVTWTDVLVFFSALQRSSRLRDDVSRLLVSEFLRYLHMIAVTDSPVFDQDDFSFFLSRPEERNEFQRAKLTRKLDAFVRTLAEDPEMRKVLLAVSGKPVAPSALIHPGKLVKTSGSYWITVGAKERRNRCHFTVRVTEQGLSIEAFSPHKSFTRRLVDKISVKPKTFVHSLHAVPADEPFMLRLREARYRDPNSPYKGQSIKSTLDYLQCHSRAVTSENVRSLVVDPVRKRLDAVDLRPEIFFIRQFRLSELVGETDVVRKVARAAIAMLPYVEYAGGLSGGSL